MRIAKFGHSCLLVEIGGARILVDPGVFSAVPDEVVAGQLDGMLVTHDHPDHLDAGLVARIVAAHPGIGIYASSGIVAQLAEKGIAATDHAFSGFAVANVPVEVLEAGHDAVLGSGTDNAAFRLGGELVVTGDSTAVALDAWKGTRVLALPIAAPWTTEVLQASFLERMRPEAAFAVHDGILVEAFRTRANGRFEAFAAEHGMRFVTLSAEPQEV